MSPSQATQDSGNLDFKHARMRCAAGALQAQSRSVLLYYVFVQKTPTTMLLLSSYCLVALLELMLRTVT